MNLINGLLLEQNTGRCIVIYSAFKDQFLSTIGFEDNFGQTTLLNGSFQLVIII